MREPCFAPIVKAPTRKFRQSPGARIAPVLGRLKAVRYQTASRTLVQRTSIDAELGEILKTLGVETPKQILAMADTAPAAAPA